MPDTEQAHRAAEHSMPREANDNGASASVGASPPPPQPERPPDEAWYIELVEILKALGGSVPTRSAQPPPDQPPEGHGLDERLDYVAWLAAAKTRLDDLAARMGLSEGMPPPPPPPSPSSSAAAATQQEQSEGPASGSDPAGWLKGQALERIAMLQASLNRQLEDARASLEDAVQNMLPPQLRQAWITECAQLCLDRETHPELSEAASVRIGRGICDSEARFQTTRAEAIRMAFAEFIGVSAGTIDVRDIPVIAIAGSGGGFRAMVATLGSYRAMHQAGLAQCVMYDAAVSGSSWAVAALHTYGRGNPYVVLDSVRQAIKTSMFSAPNLAEFVSEKDAIAKQVFSEMATRSLLLLSRTRADPPTTSTAADPPATSTAAGALEPGPGGAVSQGTAPTLTGVASKAWDGLALIAGWAVDTVLPMARRAQRAGPSAAEPVLATVDDLLHAAGTTLRSLATLPMSIVDLYGALLFRKLLVQHSRGADDGSKPEMELEPQWVRLSAQREAVDQGRQPMPIYTAVRHFLGSNNNDPARAQNRRYQWFELSPYEIGSIDHGVWVASWAFGRPMAGGREQARIGEAHFGSILGAVSSAFCASAKAMVMELYLAVPAVMRATMDPLLDRIEDDAEASHPIAPYTLHNPFYGIDAAPGSGNDGVAELAQAPLLSLMDAGLENNLPFAPLLRPERGVDVVVCLDASANIEVMPWFARAEAWAGSHGAERWPWGARPWAADPLRPSKAEAALDKSMLSGARSVREHTAQQIKEGNLRCATFDQAVAPSPLRRPGDLTQPPITVVYLPLLPNRQFRDPAFDPEKAAFCATFNDKWTGEQVDLLADLAAFNFAQELERVREAVATAYRRKRAHRLYRERASRGK